MAVLTEVGAQGGCSKAQGNTLIMLAPKVGQTAAFIPQNRQNGGGLLQLSAYRRPVFAQN